MQYWRFLYTTESSFKKALSVKDKQPMPGKSKFIVTAGKDYNNCYVSAMSRAKFNERQLIGSRQLTEKEISDLK